MNILIDGQTLHTDEINRGIGTYFKEMVESMLKNDFTSRFFIMTTSHSSLDCFSTYAKNKLNVLCHDNADTGNILSNDRQNSLKIYSELVKNLCVNHKIDFYWNPNPQMNNTILPEKIDKNTKYVATIYDLIPYIMKKNYYDKWPGFIQKEYENKLEILNSYDHLFPISNNTKKDMKNISKIDDSKQTVTFCGVNKKFTYYPFPSNKVDEGYILYIGGFDPRKNMFKALKAFSIFQKNHDKKKKKYKFYLVCSLNDHARKELEEYASNLGIVEDLVLTGYVEDTELLKIYQKAKAFFFPSLYEGFGLPVLEALSSGLPVACSNNSSLPEVAKEYAEYFDCQDEIEMAKSLQKVLSFDMTLESRIKRNNYALEYSWDKSADVLMTKLSELHHDKSHDSKQYIAWVSPLPPQKSGISVYSKLLIMRLKEYIKIDVFYDSTKVDPEILENFKCYKLEELATRFDNYDEVIYHIGNNTEFHTNIYKYAWNYPSTVVIHDWNIHPFMHHSFLKSKNFSYYKEAIEFYGDEGLEELEQIKQRGYPDIWKFPMTDAIASKSKRVIVHHQWVKNQLIKQDNVEVIPLFSFIKQKPKISDIEKFKEMYHISEKEYLVTMFGDINTNKLPSVQIEAIKYLIDSGYPIKMIFAGKVQRDTKELFKLLSGTKYEGKIIATGYLPDKVYLSCLYSSDIIINLRNPSMGEASLTLAEAFFAEKPVIIGDLNQYKEFPDDVVMGKIKYDGTEKDQLVSTLKFYLENNKQTTVKKINNIQKYRDKVCSLENVVKLYLQS